MDDGQDHDQLAEELVQVLAPVKPGQENAGQCRDHGDDHERAQGVVADIASGPQAAQVSPIIPKMTQRAREVRKPGVAAANHAPDEPEHQKPADAVSGGDMNPIGKSFVLGGQIGDDDQREKRPMKQARWQVPHDDATHHDLLLRAEPISLRSARFGRHDRIFRSIAQLAVRKA